MSPTRTAPESTLAAHNTCLQAEQVLTNSLASPTSISSERKILEKNLVNVRILGHLLTSTAVAPTRAAQLEECIASSVSSCKDLTDLVGLGDFFDKHLIRLCIEFILFYFIYSEASWCN